MEIKEFYTIKEVMKSLQLSRITLYRYIYSGKLKTYKFGKEHRIKKEDLDAFLEEHKQS